MMYKLTMAKHYMNLLSCVYKVVTRELLQDWWSLCSIDLTENSIFDIELIYLCVCEEITKFW